MGERFVLPLPSELPRGLMSESATTSFLEWSKTNTQMRVVGTTSIVLDAYDAKVLWVKQGEVLIPNPYSYEVLTRD